MQGLFGIALVVSLAWGISSSRWSISWTKVARLFFSQVLLMIVFLTLPPVKKGFMRASQSIEALRQSVREGTRFVFGYLGGDIPPFAVAEKAGTIFIFMFQALPVIIVMSSLSMVLFHWRILPTIVRFISRAAQSVWHIGGALATAMGAKLFLGQTDTPLLIRPYLASLSRNELFSLMVAGMATTSATLFVLYATLLETSLGVGQAFTHILTSTVINIPASLLIAEIMIPHQGPLTHGHLSSPYTFTSSAEALAQGATDGWKIMGNIAAMLIAVLAFVNLANIVLDKFSFLILGKSISLEMILGYFFWPFSWAIGIPSAEAFEAGSLLAIKTIFNEIIAFAHSDRLSPRSLSILIYSLCGFGNLSSLAIQIAGLTPLAPQRKQEITSLAPRALFAGTLAGGLSSALASLIL